MKLSEIQNRTRKVEIDFQGESLEVEYRANVVTPAFLSDRPEVVEQVRRAVIRWNIVDDDGKEMPVGDVVEDLPVALLVEIITAITEDIRVSGEEKKG